MQHLVCDPFKKARITDCVNFVLFLGFVLRGNGLHISVTKAHIQ